MRATASAPGKAFVLGEYAVLDGAPALVAALDRRAVAAVTTATHWSISARFAGQRLDADIATGADGAVLWPDRVPGETRHALRLVHGVLETLSPGLTAPGRPAATVTLDTSAFYDGEDKLGIGSSAAATVALAGALLTWAGQRSPDLARLVAMHRTFQDGRGSGADVAAALHGGVVRVQAGRSRDELIARPQDWPDNLSVAWLWTGQSADTRHYLGTLSAWRRRNPASATATMDRLCRLACQPWSDGTALLALAGDYARALDELDRASGLRIFAGAHATLRDLAANGPVVYKPCGAGGGDLGIALATDTGALASFVHRAARAGIRSLPVLLDRAGLRTNTDLSGDDG